MKFVIRTSFVVMFAATLSSCVQMPTEKQSNVDLRPQLSFSVENPALNPQFLEVFVDDLQVGVVGSYMVGQQAVRILPGTHVIRVVREGRAILEERIYVGDGMTRIIVVN